MDGWCFVGYGLLCWMCLALLLQAVVCENGTSPVGFDCRYLSVCITDAPSVCGYI